MSEQSRAEQIKRRKGQAVVRALHEAELVEAGAGRTAALQKADDELDRIARLLPDALAAGLGMKEISGLTGVSRPTLYELRGRYSDADRDLRLAVLTAVLFGAFEYDLAELIGKPEAVVRSVLRGLIDEGWVDELPEFLQPLDGDGSPAVQYSLTVEGHQALERWQFEDDGESHHEVS